MVSITELWLAIGAATVIFFVASSLIHMFLKYHKNDVLQVPNEDAVRAALRPFNIAPGDYMIPRAENSKDMCTPAFTEKLKEGPVAIVTVFANGPFHMGKNLAQWFVFGLVVNIFAAYVAGRALPAGTEYLRVFQISGCVAFMGYGLALLQNSIWTGRSWCATGRHLLDALLYGLLSGGVFGWLWPR